MKKNNQLSVEEHLLFFLVTLLMAFENSLNLIFMSGLLRDQPSFISGFARYGITYALIISILFLVIVIDHQKKEFRSSWNIAILYIMLSIWAIFNSDGGHSQNINGTLSFIRMPLIGISCMLAYEHMFSTKKAYNWIKITDILILSIIALGVYMIFKQLSFYKLYSNRLTAANNVYFIIPLFTYWMCKENKIYLWLSPFLSLCISLVALKRGAILASSAMFFASENIRRKLKDIPSFLLSAISFILVGYVLFSFIDDHLYNGFLTERFLTISEGSGRRGQIEWALQVFPHIPFFNLLVGHGLDASDIRFNLFLHNDWLRIIYDFGLIGMTLYAAIYFIFFKKIYSLRTNHSPYTASWTACSVFAFCLSLYSSVTWVYILNVLPIFGFIIGLEKKEKILNQKNSTKLNQQLQRKIHFYSVTQNKMNNIQQQENSR